MFEQHFRLRHIINRETIMPLGYISMAGINLSIVKEEENDDKKGVAGSDFLA